MLGRASVLAQAAEALVSHIVVDNLLVGVDGLPHAVRFPGRDQVLVRENISRRRGGDRRVAEQHHDVLLFLVDESFLG